MHCDVAEKLGGLIFLRFFDLDLRCSVSGLEIEEAANPDLLPHRFLSHSPIDMLSLI